MRPLRGFLLGKSGLVGENSEERSRLSLPRASAGDRGSMPSGEGRSLAYCMARHPSYPSLQDHPATCFASPWLVRLEAARAFREHETDLQVGSRAEPTKSDPRFRRRPPSSTGTGEMLAVADALASHARRPVRRSPRLLEDDRVDAARRTTPSSSSRSSASQSCVRSSSRRTSSSTLPSSPFCPPSLDGLAMPCSRE